MNHLFRLNVAGQGYTLLSGTQAELREEPLDLASARVPEAYLRVQSRLDTHLERSRQSWSLASARIERASPCAVGYGYLAQVPDARGRVGLRFVHAVLLEDARELPTAVMAIVRTLVPTFVDRLTAFVAETAAAAGPGDYHARLRDWLAADLETQAHAARRLLAERQVSTPVAGSVRHDCAAAAPIAWLALSERAAAFAPPWEFHDRTDASGSTSTVLDPTGPVLLASNLLASTSGLAATDQVETSPGRGAVMPPAPSAEYPVKQPTPPDPVATDEAAPDWIRSWPLPVGPEVALRGVVLLAVAYLLYPLLPDREVAARMVAFSVLAYLLLRDLLKLDTLRAAFWAPIFAIVSLILLYSR